MPRLIASRFSLLTGVAAVAALGAWAASGTHYMFTTNHKGTMGVRITLDTKSDGTYSDIPCAASVQEVEWAPNGVSWGIARNRDFSPSADYLFVSIKSDNPVDCGASSGYCMGVAWYSVGSPPSGTGVSGRSFTTAWNQSDDGIFPDTIGNADAGTMLVAVLDKRAADTGAASVEEWQVGTSNTWGVGGYDELSQVEWVGTGGYLVYTVAGTTVSESSCNCGSTGCGTLGELALGRMGWGRHMVVASRTAWRTTGSLHRAGRSSPCFLKRQGHRLARCSPFVTTT